MAFIFFSLPPLLDPQIQIMITLPTFHMQGHATAIVDAK
jgi:hypothetical protein